MEFGRQGPNSSPYRAIRAPGDGMADIDGGDGLTNWWTYFCFPQLKLVC
jgi:hypothetical protein